MGKEASVAPKERVNITYRPATGDQTEEVELPLRILMMGDYTQRADDTEVEERKTIEVDGDNFDAVLASMGLSLDLTVEDRLSGDEGSELPVSLKIQHLSDFSPDSIARQVTPLRQLVELRETLIALKSPLAERPRFRKRLEALLDSDQGRARLMRELGLGDE